MTDMNRWYYTFGPGHVLPFKHDANPAPQHVFVEVNVPKVMLACPANDEVLRIHARPRLRSISGYKFILVMMGQPASDGLPEAAGEVIVRRSGTFRFVQASEERHE